MKKQCITCGKESDNKKDFFELSGQTGATTICRICAAEIGINNFFSAGFCSNTKALKKYVELHPEAQFRLDHQTELLNQYKNELRGGFAELTKNYSQMSNEHLKEALRKYIVTNAGLNLQNGEVCYFCSECYSIKYKDVVVGTTRTSIHVGRSRKGKYLGTGMSQQLNNRQIVAEKYPGTFYLTNQRMVCNAVKLSFEIPLKKITTMTCYQDGLSIMSSGKTYNVELKNIERLKTIIELSNEYEKRKV